MLTPAEKQFIADNAARMKDRDIAWKLSELSGRPISKLAVDHARRRMGILKKHGRGVCGIAEIKKAKP